MTEPVMKKYNPALNLSIKTLDLPIRFQNALTRRGVSTIHHAILAVRQYDKEGVAYLPGVGQVCIETLRKALEDRDFLVEKEYPVEMINFYEEMQKWKQMYPTEFFPDENIEEARKILAHHGINLSNLIGQVMRYTFEKCIQALDYAIRK
jgi:hypothetical protein